MFCLVLWESEIIVIMIDWLTLGTVVILVRLRYRIKLFLCHGVYRFYYFHFAIFFTFSGRLRSLLAPAFEDALTKVVVAPALVVREVNCYHSDWNYVADTWKVENEHCKPAHCVVHFWVVLAVLKRKQTVRSKQANQLVEYIQEVELRFCEWLHSECKNERYEIQLDEQLKLKPLVPANKHGHE